jgi:hypothetical protein
MCVCCLRYPACNAHAPYCHLWPARLFGIFPQYLINGTIFEKEKLLSKKCMFRFSLQLSSETFPILRRNEWDVIKNVYWSSSKLSFIFVRFLWNLNFLDIFSKNPQISNFMKIRPVGTELFHADGRTDERKNRRTGMTKLIIAFRNFANVPNESLLYTKIQFTLHREHSMLQSERVPSRCACIILITNDAVRQYITLYSTFWNLRLDEGYLSTAETCSCLDLMQ